MRQPLLSMRLFDHHRDPQLLADHLALMLRQREACDEVWFASSYGFPPLAYHQEGARQMAEAAAHVRAAGISASLQISNTLGHGAYLKFLDFTGLTHPMVGDDGTVSPYAWCPRVPEFHTYLDGLTCAYCAWQPDRLWIDDDMRMHHHAPAEYGCFCEHCLAEFSTVVGQMWTREALVKAINEENDLATRAAWLQFGRESLAGVARTVGRAAIAVAPECQLGFQHCDLNWGGYNGPDWKPVYAALREASGRAVGSRPGGGFYHDHQPREMLYKALMTGLQTARLPADIGPVCYECENLPGSRFGKSAQGTALECTLAIAYGCDSLSFTPLMFPHETTWHETMLAQLSAYRPFWERYVAANVGTNNAGVDVVLSHERAQRELRPSERRFAWATSGFGAISPTATLGLPLSWESGMAAWLSADSAVGVNEADLRRLLARGLLVDGAALEILEQRGLAHLLGLRYQPVATAFNYLHLSDDALNGEHAGQQVVCGCFMFGKAHGCEVTEGHARILSRYVHHDGTLAEVEAVAIEHVDGGRLVVFGWGVGNATVTTSRRQQILAAANWVSHGRLPVQLDTPSPVVVVPRCDANGRLATVLLLNVSLDPTPVLTLSMSNTDSAGRWTWLRPLEADVILPAENTVTLPPLAPWSAGVLVRG